MRYVYFMGSPDRPDHPVKIGCSKVPHERLRTLAAWSPFPLEVVASLPGPIELERRFHTKFRHLHTHHEWFRADAELTRTIEQVAAGTFDVDSLPKINSFWVLSTCDIRAANEAGLNSRKIHSIRRRGIEIPAEVEAATRTLRMNAGEKAAARAIVKAFVDSVREREAA